MLSRSVAYLNSQGSGLRPGPKNVFVVSGTPQRFYRTLDLLAGNKERIETTLFEKARDLFTIDLDLVLWDTTSTYFEGNGPDEIGAFGLSKDHRPDRVQVKSLVRNRQYRRFLLIDRGRIGIDEEAVEREGKYDGKWILKTNTAMPAEEVAMACKSLWQVERAFLEMKSSLDLMPVYHWSESRVRGHIMVCFLALVLESGLMRALTESRRETKEGGNVAGGDGNGTSLKDLMADLKRLQAMKVELDGKQYPLRTEFQGKAYEAFKALCLRPPEKFQVLAENVKQEAKEANTELV